MHWILPGDAEEASNDAVCQASVKQAVQESMQAVVAALQQEAEETGFGQHVLVRVVQVAGSASSGTAALTV